MKIILYVKWREPNNDAGYRRLASFLTCALRSDCNLMILKELLVIFVTLAKKIPSSTRFFFFSPNIFSFAKEKFSFNQDFFARRHFFFIAP